MNEPLCILIQADEGNTADIIYGSGFAGLRCAVREHYGKEIAENEASDMPADFKASNIRFCAEHSDALVAMLEAQTQWEPGRYKLKNIEPQWQEWTLLVVATHPATEWVPVGERLPEWSGWVIAFDGYIVGPARYSAPHRQWFAEPGLPINATHWMPLPPPPAEPK